MSAYAQGTREEVEKTGAEMEYTPSCSKHIKGQNMGCQFYSGCIFASKSCGNLWDGKEQFIPFRDNGPRNVGYDLTLSAADDGHRKQDFMPCTNFMADLAKRAELSGNTGERIRVVAVEGQTIVYSEKTAVDPTGKTGNMAMKETIHQKFKVPAFKRIGEQFASKYAEAIAAAQAKDDDK